MRFWPLVLLCFVVVWLHVPEQKQCPTYTKEPEYNLVLFPPGANGYSDMTFSSKANCEEMLALTRELYVERMTAEGRATPEKVLAKRVFCVRK